MPDPNPVLTFTIGREYGRNDGRINPDRDFCGKAAEEGHGPHYLEWVVWRFDHPHRNGSNNLEYFPNIAESRHYVQGSEPLNGMSFHGWNFHSDRQDIALMGIPLEVWTGHWLDCLTKCNFGDTSVQVAHRYDLAFVTDPQNPPDHPVSSIGPGHYHLDPAEFRRLQDRVAALEWTEKSPGAG